MSTKSLWATICDEADATPDASFGAVWQRLMSRGSDRTRDEVMDAFLANEDSAVAREP